MNAVSQTIKEKFEALKPLLDERGRRRWAATEARAIGRGGVERLFEATGIARSTVRTGLQELGATQSQGPPAAPAGRQRRAGGGRKRLSELDPDLRTALEQLVEPLTRGDPTSPLRWTCKSAAKLAERLQAEGHPVSERTVNRMLHELGYRLQTNRKTLEGRQHPDRDAQFAAYQRTLPSVPGAGAAGDIGRHEEEGIDRPVPQRRARMATAGAAGRGEGVRLPGQGVGQGDSIRGIRLGGQRGLGQCRGGPRHGGVCGGDDSALVAADGRACLWRGTALADHGRRWRLQRQPQPPVEVGAAAARR